MKWISIYFKRLDKEKYIIMSIIRKYLSYIRQRFRLSSIKIILLTFILILIILYTQLFNKKDQWCDPTKPLWWFCPWPGDETICSWHQHFAMGEEKTR
jgi:hypothetical protein